MTEVNELDQVVQNTIQEAQRGKEDLFKLGNHMRLEFDSCRRQLIEIHGRIDRTVDEVDKLDREYRDARKHQEKIRKELNTTSKQDIVEAYETVHQKATNLMRKQETEKILRLERDHLEKNIRIFREGSEKSEKLMSAVGMAIKLLQSDLIHYSTEIGEARQIQNMGLSIIRAQEEERRRVAREIHDGPAQSLANIVMRAEYCLKLITVTPEKVPEELKELMWLVRNSLEDVRKIIFDLRPMSLDDLGLLPALKRYIEQFIEESNMYVELNISGRERRLDDSLEIALFRIIQESLTNIRKHSGAPDAVIGISYSADEICVSIRDSGRGFDPMSVKENQHRNSFGLTGMEERVQLLKGKFSVESKPGNGTQIKVCVPVMSAAK